MRKIGTAMILLTWLCSCQENANESEPGIMKVSVNGKEQRKAEPEIKEYDFGQLKLGDSIEYTFQVKNTGPTPIIIENVKASCGCTTVDWMKGAIAPGKTGWIQSRLKPTDKGRIRKSVVAQLNTMDPFVVFYLSGEVVKTESIVPK
jgi:hypothetical protein